MRAIGWLLVGTVILAYICAFLERYGRLLLVLTGQVLLGVLGLVVLVVTARAAWSWLCHWWELREVRLRAAQAIQRANAHYEKSRSEMEQLARAHHLRKEVSQ